MMTPGDESVMTEELAATGEVEAVASGVDPKLVPVSEAIRYRKRAQAAEQEVADLQQQLDAVGSDLQATSARMALVERAHEIDQLLVEANALDFDSARLLVVAALDESGANVGGDGSGSPVANAVAEVRKRKPHLFRMVASADGSIAGGGVGGAVRVRDRQGARPVSTAAARALASGRHQDVLRYMRLRRAGV